MSKHRHRPSQRGEPNVATPAQDVAPTQEKTMEAQEPQTSEPTQQAPAEQQGPTAKQMAAMEEANQLRALKIAQQAAEPPPEPAVPIAAVAARGYDALHEQFRQHAERSKPKEYVPPPRTERQMSALQEELEAGRRAGERARAQQEESQRIRALNAASDAAKEGFTTPVYRPDDMVPDPISGGHKTFGPDA